MRVISGTLKGRNIEGFNLDGTRPTMDRVKESLFASIQNYIEGATVLDLFAGSGNLGIEAISNGSDFVYFCDKNSEAVKVINKNLDNFRIKDKALVYNLDYMECLKILSNNKKSFDIIFLDPPYAMEVLSDVIEFVFDMLKDQYFGKVFINPTLEMYHQYWSDNMIVVNKLITEAPKSATISWHTRLEKLLVE